ncbi:hypothetical protein DesfrDRAFT_4035 [Solidesulfovibrio fructosivorans JJ]]|uniref:RiboL-PSP-HEPN domain-containing protein n=1 Tax=Solidesulfovibrio fructosivorans JJ] TaxID=596151 RepID=E1K2D5_SOLFR|nr:HEPN domain-containing protein [Solidesulfovibrio fructosivorans]EFL49221.1 hypothetical protein DesfrDRAFT_4035 [Solidesulfovibrio fructosivorans JJ]]
MKDELKTEVDGFIEMLESIERILGGTTPRVESAGPSSHIVLTNCGVFLILSAIYEEYIKSVLRQACKIIIKDRGSISMMPIDIVKSHIEVSSNKLKQAKAPNGVNLAELRAIAENLYNFTQEKEEFDLYIDDICTNDRNITAPQIKELCKKIGIKEILEKVSQREKIKKYFGIDNVSTIKNEVSAKLMTFINKRNEIVHGFQLNKGVSANDIVQFVEFFKVFSIAFAEAVNAEILTILPVAIK